MNEDQINGVENVVGAPVPNISGKGGDAGASGATGGTFGDVITSGGKNSLPSIFLIGLGIFAACVVYKKYK